MSRFVMFAMLFACGDNRPVAYILDAPPDTPEDACVPFLPDANTDCCALYPDDSAIAACAGMNLPLCACVTLACAEVGTCAYHRVHVCNNPPGECP